MVWGTDEQKDRFLGPILSGEEIWCQGFSEPDAGSDLAALKTRAVPDGDGWRVTGQKVWTSGAQYSKWCMLVARTDTDGREAQGPDVLPDGHGAGGGRRCGRCARSPASRSSTSCSSRTRGSPASSVVGGVGNGWKVALTTLMNERAGLAFFLQVRLRRLLDDLIDEAAARGLLDDDVVADRLGALHVKAEMLRLTAYRGLTAIENYGQPGPEGSLTKWMWSDANQELAQLAADLARRPRRSSRGRAGATSCCAPAATRSRAARRRSSRTSSPSACSACRGRAGHELRLHRGPADDQGHRARAARRAARRSTRVRAAAEARRTTSGCGASCASWAGRGSPSPEAHGGQGLGRGGARRAARGARLRASRPRRSSAACSPRSRSRTPAATRSATAGCRASRRGELTGAFGGARARRRRARRRRARGRSRRDGGARVLAARGRRRRAGRRRSTRRAATARVAGTAASRCRATWRGALDRGAAAVAAELVGVCQRALDMTVAYVKERKQFGVPVGAFQAVAHRCAQMLLHTEGARSAAYFAAWAADAAPERLAGGRRPRPRGGRRGRARGHRLGDPGARRHRLHVGGRRALALQARAARRRAARPARQHRVAARPARSRGWCAGAAAS